MLPILREFSTRNDAKCYTISREHQQNKSIKLAHQTKNSNHLLSLICTDSTCPWSCTFNYLKTKQTVLMFCAEESNVYIHSVTCTSSIYCTSISLVDLSINQERIYKEHLQKISNEEKSKLLGNTLFSLLLLFLYESSINCISCQKIINIR
jgi:hypothetical protein